jgi:hypothetical protein
MLQDELANPNGLRPHFPVEIRFTDADDIWLSPSFGQRSTWIGFIQYRYVRCSLPPGSVSLIRSAGRTASRYRTASSSPISSGSSCATAVGRTGPRRTRCDLRSCARSTPVLTILCACSSASTRADSCATHTSTVTSLARQVPPQRTASSRDADTRVSHHRHAGRRFC